MTHHRVAIFVAVAGLLIVAAVPFAGTQARIEGRVTDLAGNPIAGATVTITTEAVAAYKKILSTDDDGEFQTLILDATRSYDLRVEADGYVKQERSFKVAAGSSDNFFEFELQTVDQAAAAADVERLEQPGYKELTEGKQLLQAGDREGARAKFAEAVAARPDLLEAHARLAELIYESGDMEAALAAARACLSIDSESSQCLAIATNAAGETGDDVARAEYMDRYRRLHPDDPTVLFNEAAVFLNNLDDEGARPLLEKCLDADPDFPECNFEYGMLLLRSGDLEGAKEHLEKYLEVAPDGPLAPTAEETIKYL
jgi:tetratricopeptide (TPR) repeat protein